MAGQKYEKLSTSDGSQKISNDTIARTDIQQTLLSSKFILAAIAIASICLNIYNYLQIDVLQRALSREESYTGLIRNVTTIIAPDNRTIDDELWTDPKYDIQVGMVALDEEFVRKHDLLPAQRYPWDTSKGIYMLHGYHSLHCVMVLRDMVIEIRDKLPQSWPVSHLTHCLHVLREDVECNPDDLPRYTGRLNAEKDNPITHPGNGQLRKCRDWNQFRQFAVANTACYDPRGLPPGSPIVDRYKSCPDGSKPWEKQT